MVRLDSPGFWEDVSEILRLLDLASWGQCQLCVEFQRALERLRHIEQP
ncbi:MAG: hypothetical protein NBKEAIPA_01064 [Nitrospirae bacterium]|nr:hypothetical protein [Nitrospirota bacterium]